MIKKDYFILFFVILAVVLIFAGLDYLIHGLSSEYAVPSRYFTNKIIFGTVIGYAAGLLFRNKKLFTRSLLVSLSISVLLQVRYFIEGYPKDFVFLFLGIHFILLLPISFVIFKLSEKWLKRGKSKK